MYYAVGDEKEYKSTGRACLFAPYLWARVEGIVGGSCALGGPAPSVQTAAKTNAVSRWRGATALTALSMNLAENMSRNFEIPQIFNYPERLGFTHP
jgi:hypothetical protein